MRIAITVMLIMLGANLMLSILDSNMLEMIESRNEKLEQLINTNWVSCPTNWQTGQTVNRVLTLICNSRSMNKTKTILSNPQTLQDLQDFLFDTMAPADLAVDWFCEQFGVNATDDVIDFVVDARFAFFGEWRSTNWHTK